MMRLLPELEHMGIRLLLNELLVLERSGPEIHLAGLDEAHYFQADNIEKAASAIPHDSLSSRRPRKTGLRSFLFALLKASA